MKRREEPRARAPESAAAEEPVPPSNGARAHGPASTRDGTPDPRERRGPASDGRNREDDVPEGLQRIFGGNWRQGSAALDVASALIGGILGLGMAGWLIDRWLGSGPAGLLVGLLLGGIVGFYRLGRVMLRRR